MGLFSTFLFLTLPHDPSAGLSVPASPPHTPKRKRPGLSTRPPKTLNA
jgi:hypothetical protein